MLPFRRRFVPWEWTMGSAFEGLEATVETASMTVAEASVKARATARYRYDALFISIRHCVKSDVWSLWIWPDLCGCLGQQMVILPGEKPCAADGIVQAHCDGLAGTGGHGTQAVQVHDNVTGLPQ